MISANEKNKTTKHPITLWPAQTPHISAVFRNFAVFRPNPFKRETQTHIADVCLWRTAARWQCSCSRSNDVTRPGYCHSATRPWRAVVWHATQVLCVRFVVLVSFRNLPIKIRKNYETLYLRFRRTTKIEKPNYETRDNAVTCIDTSHFGGVS